MYAGSGDLDLRASMQMTAGLRAQQVTLQGSFLATIGALRSCIALTRCHEVAVIAFDRREQLGQAQFFALRIAIELQHQNASQRDAPRQSASDPVPLAS